MNDITVEHIRNFLVQTEFELKPTQGSLCLPVLLRIIDKINRGARFSPIHVVDNLVINGHHRYISYSFLNLPVETTTWRHSEATEAKEWNEVMVELEDWDKPEDIERHENNYFPKH
jgi:hypothetical protein